MGTPSKYLGCSLDNPGQSLLPFPTQEKTQGPTHRWFPGHRGTRTVRVSEKTKPFSYFPTTRPSQGQADPRKQKQKLPTDTQAQAPARPPRLSRTNPRAARSRGRQVVPGSPRGPARSGPGSQCSATKLAAGRLRSPRVLWA